MTKRKTIEKKLDKIWATIGKEKARCEICESLPIDKRVKYKQLHPHHIIGRGHRVTRWDLRNRLWVCPSHHTLGRINVQENQKGWFWSSGDCWLCKNKPDTYEFVNKKWKQTRKWGMGELIELLEVMKKLEEEDKKGNDYTKTSYYAVYVELLDKCK